MGREIGRIRSCELLISVGVSDFVGWAGRLRGDLVDLDLHQGIDSKQVGDGVGLQATIRFPNIRWGTFRHTTYFLGGGCEQDWKFLCSDDSVLSCIGHAKE